MLFIKPFVCPLVLFLFITVLLTSSFSESESLLEEEEDESLITSTPFSASETWMFGDFSTVCVGGFGTGAM